jgi:hypothetical protein
VLYKRGIAYGIQLTQLSEVGWLLGASGVLGKGTSNVVYVTLVSPDRRDFTVVIVNSGSGAQILKFDVLDSLLQLQHGVAVVLPKALQVWRTDAERAFYHDGTIAFSINGSFTATVDGASAASFSTVTDAVHATPFVPSRSSFPLPYLSNYNEQSVGQEGQYLSSAFGGFNIYELPNSSKKVLRQGSVGCPVGWDTPPGETPNCLDLPPFATLPSGTNWRNYNITVKASIEPALKGLRNSSNTGGGSDGALGPPPSPPHDLEVYASLCGRIPVWPLRLEGLKMSPMVGSCLLINATHWILEQRNNVKATAELSGLLTTTPGGWHKLSLSFDEDLLSAAVDDVVVANSVTITSAWNGVAGVGSGRHHAYYDDLRLAEVVGKGSGITAGSFLLDVAPMGCSCQGCHHPVPYDKPAASGPSTPILHTDGGWGGFVLDNTQGNASVSVSALGRYKLPGNNGTHSMNIWDVSAGRFMLTTASAALVKLDGCVPDVLGFCYSNTLAKPLVLQAGHRYYIV